MPEYPYFKNQGKAFMRKLALLLFLSIFLTSSSIPVFAALCDATKANPCIVQDTKQDLPEIKNFRTVKMILDRYDGNVKGLEGVWMSGSGAISREGWKALAANIKSETKGKVKRMINIDLREESHGFLNGNSINLTSEYNWINRGKTSQQSLADEERWLGHLSTQIQIDNVLTASQFKSGKFVQGTVVPVVSLESEATLTDKAGFHYFRLAVSDHMAPRDEEVDKFIHLITNLSGDTWIHLHCRGGNGRTTTFFVMYDMLKNADQVSFDEIIKRHASVPPFYNLQEVDRNDPELTPYYKDRLVFLHHFYRYAQARLKGYKGSWSTWSKKSSSL